MTEFKWASAAWWKVQFCTHVIHFSPLSPQVAERTGWRDACMRCRFERKMWAVLRNKWIYKRACSPGCTVPPCTQVSCKLSWWFYLLVFHVQYCWMCCCSAGEKSDYVQRLDGRGGSYKPQGKPIISKNLCIIRCIPSRTVDQNLLATRFLTKSDLLLLWLYVKPTERSEEGTQFHVSLRGGRTTSTSSVCLQALSDGLTSFDGKGTWQILYMCCIELCYNHVTPLIIPVTCLRFAAPEVNMRGTHTYTKAGRLTTIKWQNTWCQCAILNEADTESLHGARGKSHVGLFWISHWGFFQIWPMNLKLLTKKDWHFFPL